MAQKDHWTPGTRVVLRGVGFFKLWWAMPVLVVQDTSSLVALYWQAGTHWMDVSQHATAQDLLASTQANPVDQVWEETDVLMLAVPGESHAVWVMWERGHIRLRCWYVNLETPLLRTPIGFDTMDHELDIVISPDRSEWRWKDEQAFNEMVKAGIFSAEEACAIRAEGERVIQHSQAGEPPFCDGWEEWLPPPKWTIPTLPPDWDMEVKESLCLQ
jgi:Protein of unknown function (DUF402)